MIDFGSFGLITPARSGGGWLALAARTLGFVPGRGCLTLDRPAAYTAPVVTLVRHPALWLASWYAVGIGRSPFAEVHWDTYCAEYLNQRPGTFWKRHCECKADIVLRLEDMPHAACEFFRSMGVEDTSPLLRQGRTNPMQTPISTARQRAAITDAEPELCEAYDYF